MTTFLITKYPDHMREFEGVPVPKFSAVLNPRGSVWETIVGQGGTQLEAIESALRVLRTPGSERWLCNWCSCQHEADHDCGWARKVEYMHEIDPTDPGRRTFGQQGVRVYPVTRADILTDEEDVYECVSDRFDRYQRWWTVESFQEMCRHSFGAEADLTRDGQNWKDEKGMMVLEYTTTVPCMS